MTYEEMKNRLEAYNWDDGFAFPQTLLDDEQCDLAMALEIFYLGDGYTYFLTFIHNIGGTKEWFRFIDRLYHAIKNGEYAASGRHYRIPLSKVQRYQMAKRNIPQVFLEDV